MPEGVGGEKPLVCSVSCSPILCGCCGEPASMPAVVEHVKGAEPTCDFCAAFFPLWALEVSASLHVMAEKPPLAWMTYFDVSLDADKRVLENLRESKIRMSSFCRISKKFLEQRKYSLSDFYRPLTQAEIDQAGRLS